MLFLVCSNAYSTPVSCLLIDFLQICTPVKVMELDLLSLDSVVRFAEAWNARLGPLHALINNAGIFSIGGLYGSHQHLI